MMLSIDQETWLQAFREFLRYCLPPLKPTPLMHVGSFTAVVVGVFLVFRSWKFERSVVSVSGLVVGAWLGYWLSLLVGTPKPISAAVGAVVMTVVAYRTYRWWLACGSVVVLFSLALAVQLGRGDMRRYLPDLDSGAPTVNGDMIGELVTAAQQDRNLHPKWSHQLAKMKDPAVRELKALGPVGWLLPVGAAIVGGLLAYWALRSFAVIWLGFLGATMVVVGACTVLCAQWPDVRAWLLSRPGCPAGFAMGLWLLGLILQAREARIPSKAAGDEPNPKDSPKS